MKRCDYVWGSLGLSGLLLILACQPSGSRLYGQTGYQTVTNKQPVTAPVPTSAAGAPTPAPKGSTSPTPSASAQVGASPSVQPTAPGSIVPSPTPTPTPTPVPVVTLFAGADRDATTDVDGNGKVDYRDTGGFADGTGSAARFNGPEGIACDKDGNVYVADTLNHRIRQITRDGVVSTYAGSGEQGYANGTRLAAKFNGPAGVAVSQSGTLYVADRGNCVVRKIAPDGQVTTLAGPGEDAGFDPQKGYVNGTGATARFNLFARLTVDDSETVYVTDGQNNCIRRITPAGVVSTVAGPEKLPEVDRDNNGVINLFDFFGWKDGPALQAEFYVPYGLALDPQGNIFVADNQNNRIRKVATDGLVSTVAGSEKFGVDEGVGTGATFHNLRAIVREPSGNFVVVQPGNHLVRRVTPSGVVTNFAGKPDSGRQDGPIVKDGKPYATFNYPIDIAVDNEGTLYVLESRNHSVRRIK